MTTIRICKLSDFTKKSSPSHKCQNFFVKETFYFDSDVDDDVMD